MPALLLPGRAAMSELKKPDRALLERWLNDARIGFDLCEHCAGLHIQALSAMEGVVDSRIFLERYGLLFTTELELRPSALLAVSADVGRLNMDYPLLKVFPDIVDDAVPHLVVAAMLPTTAGITQEQFVDFAASSMEGTRHLSDECLRLGYLFPEAEDEGAGPASMVH